MNRLILDTLKDIGAPVAFEEYTGKEPTYVRFFYLPQIQFSSDDKEKYTTHYVQVDIFSPVNLTQLSNNVKDKMTGENISDRKSTRLNSSHVAISYAVFCLKKKKYQNLLNSIKP